MNNNIMQIIDRFIKEEDFSGAILIKQGDNVLYNSAHGYAHRGFKVPNNTSTKFDCAGVTKLFTAVSIFQLIADNKLNLEDSVARFLDLSSSKINKAITVEQLLTHTSGLGENWNFSTGTQYEDFFNELPNYSIKSLKDMYKLFCEKDEDYTPGEKSEYNNCGYILLGLIIEKIEGIEYKDYVEKNIFQKYGMKDSGFFSKTDSTENLAEGYDDIFDEDDNIIGFKKNIYSYPPEGFSDRGAYVTAGDLCLFIENLMSGKIIDKKYVDEMTSNKISFSSRDGNDSCYGYAFELLVDSLTSEVKLISKSGINHGVTALMMYLPKFDFKAIMLANSYSNIWNLSYKLMAEFYQVEERC